MTKARKVEGVVLPFRRAHEPTAQAGEVPQGGSMAPPKKRDAKPRKQGRLMKGPNVSERRLKIKGSVALKVDQELSLGDVGQIVVAFEVVKEGTARLKGGMVIGEMTGEAQRTKLLDFGEFIELEEDDDEDGEQKTLMEE